MKYSDLISFNPIEDVIQLTMADDADRAKEYVKSYVMSDTMAVNLIEHINIGRMNWEQVYELIHPGRHTSIKH